MTRRKNQLLSDREDLRLLEKYIAKHRERGTAPAAETLARYDELRKRVPDARSDAA